MKAVYASSYDRGLECLLDMWPKIRELAPKAELDIYYGWDSFDNAHGGNKQQQQWKWKLVRKINALKDQGVVEHGRVSHEYLAQAFRSSKVWLYPTEFNEINCITALKAQAAGCIPVTTGCYALAETVLDKHYQYGIVTEDIYTNQEAQALFISFAVNALEAEDWQAPDMSRFYWSNIAKQWAESL